MLGIADICVDDPTGGIVCGTVVFNEIAGDRVEGGYTAIGKNWSKRLICANYKYFQEMQTKYSDSF